MCALCRTESLPPPRRYPQWVLGGLLLAILLVSGGAVAYRAATSLAHAAIAPEPARGRAVVELASGSTGTAPGVAAPGAPDTTTRQGESIPFDEPIPPPVTPALGLAQAPMQAPEARASASAAAAARPLPAPPSRPPPSQSELQAALQATPIVMYSTSWCAVCRKARQLFAENGLRYRDIDVDKTPGGWDKVVQLGGQRAVPVIIVDERVMLGLDPDSVMRAVAHSMERRLGVTGIAFKSK